MDETAATRTLASPSSLHAPLPTIPFDLIPEILCRLSVKLLIQLKCVCKSWNSLISDPKFAKKHLRMSTACHDHNHHLIVANSKHDAFSTHAKVLLSDSTISSIFSNLLSNSTVPQLKLLYTEVPLYNGPVECVVSSRDGILLFDVHLLSPLLWNPSIRKFKILPPFLEPSRGRPETRYVCTFGYDHFIDNYKIFATCCIRKSEVDINLWKREVSVYTLGYDSWRRIDDIPGDDPILEPGIFVSGSVNWLPRLKVIVSLDLKKESYRKLLTPDLKNSAPTLGVLRDSLCIFADSVEFLDVWVMKEYGIKESWTKLFSVRYKLFSNPFVGRCLSSYVSEDEQGLLAFEVLLDYKLVVYNSRNGTFKIPKIQNISAWMVPKVYVESLISPCS